MRRIECRNLFKRFHHKSGQRLLRSHIAGWLRPRESEWFYALKNVSFDVDSGESLAIVGRNGAGKSTLLSVITGLARPDYGSIQVKGRTAALLELGSGFHPDLTGAENVQLNAALLGFTRKQTNQLFDIGPDSPNNITPGPAVVDNQVAALHPAELLQRLGERGERGSRSDR